MSHVMLNCREEIQRIKANNPDISHREAFSTAAKNVRVDMNMHVLVSSTINIEICQIFVRYIYILINQFNYFYSLVGALPSYSFWIDVGD